MAPKSERPGSLYQASSLVVLFSCLDSNLVPWVVLVLSFASSPPTQGGERGGAKGGRGGLYLVQKLIHDLALF